MRTVLCSMRTVSCRCTRTCSSNSRHYIAITMTLAQVSKAKVRQVGGTFSRTPTPPEHKGNFLLCGVWYPCLSGYQPQSFFRATWVSGAAFRHTTDGGSGGNACCAWIDLRIPSEIEPTYTSPGWVSRTC